MVRATRYPLRLRLPEVALVADQNYVWIGHRLPDLRDPLCLYITERVWIRHVKDNEEDVRFGAYDSGLDSQSLCVACFGFICIK